ncbi:MAG: alpha/beta fold hydrolase [Myxococcales bacterium]|jgi:pimeloyl-ACP methyl ester carboxylesterase
MEQASREFAYAAERVVVTPRGRVEYAEHGEGPAVLSLHGIMGGHDQSQLLARAVAKSGFRFISVSRPGYLGTPLKSGRTPEEQADLLAALLDVLQIDRAAVAAVSGGGPAAVQFALRHPDRCWALVMTSACSARLSVPLPFAWYILRLSARVPFLVTKMREQGAKDPEAPARRSIPDPELRERTLRDPEAGPLLLALQASTMDRLRLRIAGAENDVRQTRRDLVWPLERIAAPALAIHGTSDEVVPFEQSKALVARAPAAELLAIEGGRHASLFTHLAKIRSRVSGFLGTHAPRSADSGAAGD